MLVDIQIISKEDFIKLFNKFKPRLEQEFNKEFKIEYDKRNYDSNGIILFAEMAITGITKERPVQPVYHLERKQKGVYTFYSFHDIDYYITNGKISHDFPCLDPILNKLKGDNPNPYFVEVEEGKRFITYGLADNLSQILKYYKSIIKNQTWKFFITYRELTKKHNGGMRFHKEGDYIGKKREGYEYFRQEPNMETLLSFQLHLLEEGSIDLSEYLYGQIF